VSGLVYFELRDTLAGYTAVTVSCAAAGAPSAGTVGAHEWDRLLGDLKIVLEADTRER
jgi:purine nucleoside permease